MTYIVTGLLLMLGMTLAYGVYARRTARPVIDSPFVGWANCLIALTAVVLSSTLRLQDKLFFVLTGSFVTAVYLFVVRPGVAARFRRAPMITGIIFLLLFIVSALWVELPVYMIGILVIASCLAMASYLRTQSHVRHN
ncbi:MAG TPA: hypothetical protein VIK33_10115 [Anaerolineae bacterium]